MKRLVLILLVILAFSSYLKAQNLYNKQESILTAQKWTVTEVKGKRPVFSLGEELRFKIDRTFTLRKNDKTVVQGKWFIDNKNLIMNIDTQDGSSSFLVPTTAKVRDLRRGYFRIKFKIEKTEKVTFK